MDDKPGERDVLTLDDGHAVQAPTKQAPATPVEREAPKLGVPAWVTEGATTSAVSETTGDMLGAAAKPTTTGASLSADELELLTAEIVGALKTVYDPEIPADIYELGLIYKIDVDDSRFVAIDMTLTAPGCPVAGEMPIWVEDAVSAVPGVSGCKATITFDPPWTQDRMSDEARLSLNMF